MFAKKKQPPIKSLIAQGSRIDGNMTFSEGLRVDGDVVGDIRVDESQPSLLVISETATVVGAVYADHVIINGRINGPVHARELCITRRLRCTRGPSSRACCARRCRSRKSPC